MEALLNHLVKPIVAHPDSVKVQIVESEDVTILEFIVHEDDYERLKEGGGRTLRSIRNIISAAAGKNRASVDLVEEFGDYSKEE